MAEAIADLKQQGVTGLVLDLRNNRGGLSSSMHETLSLLMPLGMYGSMVDINGSTTSLSSSVNDHIGVATVVLVNANTSCEAEFIAGAMQEQSLATIVGVKTAGKAKYQEFVKIKLDNSAVKLTRGNYSLLKGGSFEGKGITPNKEVSLTAQQQAIFPLLTSANDPQLKMALEQLGSSNSDVLNNATTTTKPSTPSDTTDGSSTTTTTTAAK